MGGGASLCQILGPMDNPLVDQADPTDNCNARKQAGTENKSECMLYVVSDIVQNRERQHIKLAVPQNVININFIICQNAKIGLTFKS